MRAHLLIMRWLLLNIGFATLGAWAWQAGLVTVAWTSDSSWITTAILALFCAGMIGVSFRIIQASVALDSVRGEGKWKVREFRLASKGENSRIALEEKLSVRWEYYDRIGEYLVMLGFAGTVYGMYIALPDLTGRSIMDPAVVTLVFSAFITGFKVAIWTTLTGIAANIVLSLNTLVLKGGYSRLYTKLLEENDAKKA